MPMRMECKHYESRSYPNGDTVRRCNLDLAPDAPWRCPADCARYERRLADVAWTHGSLVPHPTPPEPASLNDGTAAALLDAAEQIINSVAAEVIAEINEQQQSRPSRFRRLFTRRRN
jgi:hypothetical protein